MWRGMSSGLIGKDNCQTFKFFSFPSSEVLIVFSKRINQIFPHPQSSDGVSVGEEVKFYKAVFPWSGVISSGPPYHSSYFSVGHLISEPRHRAWRWGMRFGWTRTNRMWFMEFAYWMRISFSLQADIIIKTQIIIVGDVALMYSFVRNKWNGQISTKWKLSNRWLWFVPLKEYKDVGGCYNCWMDWSAQSKNIL